MKKIALLMDCWQRQTISAWPSGILEELKRREIEASLYIFCCAGNWSSDAAYNEGEYGIFSLPNFSEFDGVIVDFTAMRSAEELQLISDRIKYSGIPAVSLEKEIDGFTLVGFDNYAAMRQIVAHLHEDHHLDRFWLIMGPDWNYETGIRERAIRDYLRENGLHLAKDDVVWGDFDYQSGIRGYRTLRRSHQELPDAIICVNDNLAIAACEEAESEGIRVPEDMAVTGFDNFDKAEFYMPRITTVENRREKLAAKAVDCLVEAWRGKEMPQYSFGSVEFLRQESCGCHMEMADIRKSLKTQVVENIDKERYATQLLTLESVMPKCKTIEEVAVAVDEQLGLMRGDSFFMMIDPKVFAISERSLSRPNARESLTDSFCRGLYPPQMQIVYAREGDGREKDFEGQMVSDIFPLLSLDEPANDYLFMPIHFEEFSIGYVAFKNVTGILKKQMYFQAVATIQRRIEEMYRAEAARQTNQRLTLLYRTDALTGIRNRLGFIEDGSTYFELNRRRGRQVVVMYLDLDNLKYINDNYGHKAGDRAIIDIADTIREVFGKDSVVARVGGDEFVAMATFLSDDDLDDIKSTIEMKLMIKAEEERLPYDLRVSIGTTIATASGMEDLDSCLKKADERMYEMKIRHRRISAERE